MDPILISVLFLVGAELGKGVISEASKDAYNALKQIIRRKFADKPEVQQALESLETNPVVGEPVLRNVMADVHVDQDEEVFAQTQRLFALSSALKRAQRVAPILQGARLLWVDNHPQNNLSECGMLRSLGMEVDLARSTSEALSLLAQTRYDTVISDIDREGRADEGLRFLSAMRQQELYRQTIFYIGKVDLEKGVPPYAFGITDRPNDLLHYVLDALERERS